MRCPVVCLTSIPVKEEASLACLPLDISMKIILEYNISDILSFIGGGIVPSVLNKISIVSFCCTSERCVHRKRKGRIHQVIRGNISSNAKLTICYHLLVAGQFRVCSIKFLLYHFVVLQSSTSSSSKSLLYFTFRHKWSSKWNCSSKSLLYVTFRNKWSF